MNWMQLAVNLTREVMKPSAPEPQKPANTDLGAALAQQFETIDRNMDAIVRALNAQNTRLEATIRRQRIWNYALTGGLLIAIIVIFVRSSH
jgi:hypothetical protein